MRDLFPAATTRRRRNYPPTPSDNTKRGPVETAASDSDPGDEGNQGGGIVGSGKWAKLLGRLENEVGPYSGDRLYGTKKGVCAIADLTAKTAS